MNRMQECCKTDGKVTLGCGHELPLVSAACNKGRFDKVDRLPLCTGKVGETGVSVLRDTGCSSGLVRASLVKEEDYTGENRSCVLIDANIRKFPDATISMETPYYSGTVEALVIKALVYDLILGNFRGLWECMEVEEQHKL